MDMSVGWLILDHSEQLSLCLYDFWLLRCPSDPDVLATPDPASLMVLPWRPTMVQPSLPLRLSFILSAAGSALHIGLPAAVSHISDCSKAFYSCCVLGLGGVRFGSVRSSWALASMRPHTSTDRHPSACRGGNGRSENWSRARVPSVEPN